MSDMRKNMFFFSLSGFKAHLDFNSRCVIHVLFEIFYFIHVFARVCCLRVGNVNQIIVAVVLAYLFL